MVTNTSVGNSKSGDEALACSSSEDGLSDPRGIISGLATPNQSAVSRSNTLSLL